MLSFSCPSCTALNKWQNVLLKGDVIDCISCKIRLKVEHITGWSGHVRVKII